MIEFSGLIKRKGLNLIGKLNGLKSRWFQIKWAKLDMEWIQI